MWVFLLFCVAQWVSSADAAPIPLAARTFLGLIALHVSYHYVTRPSLHSWPFMRRLIRYSFLHYAYFRLNVTVFDSAKIDTEMASKSVMENDISPFVKPNDRAMFAFHPHGVLSNGWAFNGAHHMSFGHAECRWLVAENLFWFPVMRDFATFHRFMPTGQNICLIPGGFKEATLYERGKRRVYIKKRFGFIKLALHFFVENLLRGADHEVDVSSGDVDSEDDKVRLVDVARFALWGCTVLAGVLMKLKDYSSLKSEDNTLPLTQLNSSNLGKELDVMAVNSLATNDLANHEVLNSAAFAAAFNCPPGAPMNPASKCVLWKTFIKS
ncbi:hypothetical protein PHYPSEUDO_001031 [Phytophthora pseudosyringae]|uniref:diacylglycerol O-acyltransferase n=1 Tax=Phytophthora pseudosyringae TaxID=221518 RepID=A0A8T1V2H2_9STRA|nr:hypothetical protein PHYPSEUDO_001031 [Phytophthora pseudosyringae]